MRKLSYIILFFLIISCSKNKSVYWCGDHACANNKEKEAYFKKTMTVEIRDLKKDKLRKSDIEKIIQQAEVGGKKEKIFRKSAKLEKKRRVKEQKILDKQAKLEAKRRIKEQKILDKQAKLETKRKAKEQKKLNKKRKQEKKQEIKEEKSFAKKIKRDEKKMTKNNITNNDSDINTTIDSTNFKKLVEKIINKNTFRPYPDINDIPN